MSIVLTDERVFSDSLLGPPSGQPIVKSKQGLVFLSRLMASAGGSPATTDDHVRFSAPSLQVGNNIIVDTTSPYTTALGVPSVGRITLQPGTYYISSSVLEVGTAATNGVIEAAIKNVETGVFPFGTGAFAAGTDRYLLHDKGVLTVTAPTRIEVNFVFASQLNSYGKAFIEIQQLA
jgi:hypothetical protein